MNRPETIRAIAGRALIVALYLVTAVAGVLHPYAHAAGTACDPRERHATAATVSHGDELAAHVDASCFFCHHGPSVALPVAAPPSASVNPASPPPVIATASAPAPGVIIALPELRGPPALA